MLTDALVNARREMRALFAHSDAGIRRARWTSSLALALALANTGGAAVVSPSSCSPRPGTSS